LTKTNKTLCWIATHRSGFQVLAVRCLSVSKLPIVTYHLIPYIQLISCMLLSSKEMNHGRSSLQKPHSRPLRCQKSDRFAVRPLRCKMVHRKCFWRNEVTWLSSLDSLNPLLGGYGLGGRQSWGARSPMDV